MTVPTQPVTVNLTDFGGPAIEGVVVKARLSDIDYTSDGVFVSTKTVTATTDEDGVAVLEVFPNAMAPDGLGTRGTRVLFTASIPRSRDLRVYALVPDEPSNLVDIMIDESDDSDPYVYVPPVQLADYEALRSYTGRRTSVYVTDYLVSAAPSGVAGLFTLDSTDTTSSDDGGTVIVGTASKRWKRVFDGPFNVKWFGAKGDATTDDAAAIAAAFSAAAYTNSPVGSAGTATRPHILFPEGCYRLASSIATDAYATLVGHRAVLLPDAGVTALTTSGYQIVIRGMVVIGGAKGLAIATGNVDTCTIRLEECEFQDQTVSAVETDLNSASTVLTIAKTRFFNVNPAAIGIKAQCIDHVVVEGGCWATWAGVFCQVGSATKSCNVRVSDFIGIPVGTPTVWFDNYGYVSATRSRFGGESGAVTVRNRGKIDDTFSDTKGIDFTDCEVQAAGNYAVEFYEIPNVFVWERIRGVNNLGFYFDPAATDLTNISTYNAMQSIRAVARDDALWEGGTEPAARWATVSADTLSDADTLKVADKLLQIDNNGSVQYGYTGATANFTQPAFTHPFGASVRGWSGDSSSYNGSAVETFATALNGMATGWKTAVFDVEVGGSMPVAIFLTCADVRVVKMVPPGKHLICVPAYFNSATSSESVGYSLSRLNNAKSIGVGPIRVFDGKVEVRTQNNVLYGTAAPTTGRWEKGDCVINSSPNNSITRSWVCTASGAPGNWVAVETVADVRWFGAVGDGVTDDTAAITAAFAAHDVVRAPKGTYKVSQFDVPEGKTLITDGFSTVFQQIAGQPVGTSIIRVVGSNVSIGSFKAIGNIATDTSEFNHALEITAGRYGAGSLENIIVGDVYAKDIRGDGVLICQYSGAPGSIARNITLGTIYYDNVLRNALSIVGGSAIGFDKILPAGTNRCGYITMDIESDVGSGPVVGVTGNMVVGRSFGAVSPTASEYIAGVKVAVMDLSPSHSSDSVPSYTPGTTLYDSVLLRNVRDIRIGELLIDGNTQGAAIGYYGNPGEIGAESVDIGYLRMRNCGNDDGARSAYIHGAALTTNALRIGHLDVDVTGTNVSVVESCFNTTIESVNATLHDDAHLLNNCHDTRVGSANVTGGTLILQSNRVSIDGGEFDGTSLCGYSEHCSFRNMVVTTSLYDFNGGYKNHQLENVTINGVFHGNDRGNKLGPVDVRWHGPAVDGVTNDSAAIQAAASAAAGKVLVIPAGTYSISSSIALESNTEVFLAPGAHITTATPNISIFTATNKSKVVVHGAGKLSQTVAGASASVAGVLFTGGCTDCVVKDLEFEGFQWAGVYILNSHRCKVTGTYMHDWLGSVDNSAGVVVYQDSNDNVVEDNHFKATGWLGSYVQDPGGLGTYNPLRNKIRNNRIEDTTAYGAMLYIGHAGNSYNEITGNTISGVLGTAGLGQYGMGIYCVGFALGGCKITDNSVTDCCKQQTVTTNGYAAITATGFASGAGLVKPIIEGNTVDGMTQGAGIHVLSCTGGVVLGPNAVRIPASNNGTGPGGAGLLGQALLVLNSSDVSISPGDYVNEGTGPAIELLATDGDYTGVTLNIGNARAAAGSAVLVSRTSTYTITGTITGGTAKSTADATNAMQLLGFSGPVSNVALRSGTTGAAASALSAASCPNLRFSNMDVESTGTYSVTISAGCTGNWDKNSRHSGRFENSAAGFQTEIYTAGIPTVGIYQVGDRAVNSGASRVVGQPKAWTRAVAGSAHVAGVDWISEGNL